MYPLVDKKKVPTVSLEDYLGGSKPRIVNLQASANRKIMQANITVAVA